jgi:hypothetical protein
MILAPVPIEAVAGSLFQPPVSSVVPNKLSLRLSLTHSDDSTTMLSGAGASRAWCASG